MSNYVNWYWLNLIFMYLVHFGIGLVWIGIIALGLTFLDDNTDMKTSPAVIGNTIILYLPVSTFIIKILFRK